MHKDFWLTSRTHFRLKVQMQSFVEPFFFFCLYMGLRIEFRLSGFSSECFFLLRVSVPQETGFLPGPRLTRQAGLTG